MFAIVALLHITAVFASEEPKFVDTAVLPELEGYQVQFDYENYPKEREIAYRYFLDRFPDNGEEDFSFIYKKDIGIDLYDIDNDGEKEIFAYLMPSRYPGYYCEPQGCPVAILKIAKKDSVKPYIEFPWEGYQYGDNKLSDKVLFAKMVILNNSTLGHKDILLFYPSGDPMELWQWNGRSYHLVRKFN
jgi:hypothetical protein